MAAIENRILELLPEVSSDARDFDQWMAEIAAEVARNVNRTPERVCKYIKGLHVSGTIVRNGDRFRESGIQERLSKTGRRSRRPMKPRRKRY